MIKHNNSLPEISLGKLKRLKQAAKKLSKETGQSHSSALDCIARREGYPNWKAVLKADKTSRHLSESTPGPSLHFAFDEDVEMSEDDTQRLENERARELPKDAKLLLAENRSFLVQKGVEHSIFETTLTGLQKSILDATQPVRAHFKMVGFHDYNDQAQGEDHKVTLDAYFLAQEKIIPSQVSMYRPQTKKGDPRMWFRGLGGYAPAGSQVAVIILDGLLHLINLTDIDLDAATKADNPLSQFILRYTDTHQETAKELLAKLKEIAKQPLPALGEADNAIGMAVEAALGIEPNSSKEPDYKGIEIKSGRGTKSRSNLFAQVADWRLSSCKSSREILENYGYERGEDFKLYCTVSTQNFNSQGLTFEYRDADDTLLEKHSEGDDVAIWKGDKLRERLCEKHAETFWVQAETEVINGVENFHLKSVVHTKSPLANQLMPLIASGVVTMDHLIKRTGGTKPKLIEKGPIFKIKQRDLSFLFPSPTKYSLTGADE